MHKAKQARDRLLDFMRACVAESRETPHEDGLSRVLGAQDAEGATIDDEDAALELHHIFLAGYIVFAFLAGLILRLEENDAIRKALEEEIANHIPEGNVTAAALAQMDELDSVVREVKRITPVLPIIFARAKKSFTFKSMTIPEGWQVSLALHESHMLDGIYKDPKRFDPSRFDDERAEHRAHPHAFAPQGPGPMEGSHKCAGTDYATYVMKMFAVLLLREYTWKLPKQQLASDGGRIPPEPKDGLRAVITKR
jgi:cytochrome P450